MKNFTRFTFILSIAALMTVSGCKMDRSIDLDKEFDSSITVGDYFGKKIATEKFILEDLVAIEDVIDLNGLDSDTTWDIIEALDMPLTIPNLSFGPFDIESTGVNAEDLDMLTGSGKLYITLDAVSSLPVDINISIDFIYPEGIVSLFEEPITIYGIGGGGASDPVQSDANRIEITADQLSAIANATGIVGEVFNSNASVMLNRNLFVEFTFTVEKTGGIQL